MPSLKIGRRLLIGLLAAVVGAALLFVGLQRPRTVTQEGVVYGHLWCLGIKFDSGEAYPVSRWPGGLQAKRNPGANSDGVLIDSSGKVVLREGQRVSVNATLTHASGDTPCNYTEILTVVSFEALPPQPSAP